MNEEILRFQKIRKNSQKKCEEINKMLKTALDMVEETSIVLAIESFITQEESEERIEQIKKMNESIEEFIEDLKEEM